MTSRSTITSLLKQSTDAHHKRAHAIAERAADRAADRDYNYASSVLWFSTYRNVHDAVMEESVAGCPGIVTVAIAVASFVAGYILRSFL